MTNPVKSNNRFNRRTHPCPVCGGWKQGSPQCKGYEGEGETEKFVFCTNSDYAGGVQRGNYGTYPHMKNGQCKCGHTHGSFISDFTSHKQNKVMNMQPTTAASPAIKKVEVGHWDYTDEAGNLVTRVIRYDRADGVKDYLQKHWDEKGELVTGMGHISHLLYRLPDILALDKSVPVVVVEGEKAADACWEVGIAATTNIGGVGKGWHEDYNHWLKPHPVIIVPDNDPDFDDKGKPHRKGQLHAASVAAQLAPYCPIKLLDPLPDVPVKGDTYDFFKVMKKTPEEFKKFTTKYAWKRPFKYFYRPDELDLIPDAKWLLEDIFTEESISMTLGESEVGKTFASIHYALRVAVETGKQVVYVGLEAISQYKERIKAWLNYYDLWDKAKDNFLLFDYQLQLMNAENVDNFIKLIKDINWKPALIVIDTYHAATEGAEENSAKDTGIILGSLRKLRNTFKTNVNVLHHLNAAGLRERGSSALRAGVDTVIELKGEGDGVKIECTKQRSAPHFKTRYINWAYTDNPVDPTRPKSRVVQESFTGTKVDLKRASSNDQKILHVLASQLNVTSGLRFSELEAALSNMAKSSLNAALKKCVKAYWIQGGERTPYIITNEGLEVIGFTAPSIEEY